MHYSDDASTGRRRTAIVAQPGENTSFVDYRDLKPINQTAAVIAGVLGGAVLGATGYMLVNDSGKSKYSNHALVFAVASTVLGGVLSYMTSKTHNDWAERISNQLANQQTNLQR